MQHKKIGLEPIDSTKQITQLIENLLLDQGTTAQNVNAD